MKFKLTASLVVLAFNVQAQKIDVEGKVKIVNIDTDKKINITLFQSGKKVDSLTIASYQNYKFSVDKGEYSFRFSAAGYEPIMVNGIRIQNSTKGLNFGLNLVREKYAPVAKRLTTDTLKRTASIGDTTKTKYVVLGSTVTTNTKYNRSASAPGASVTYYDAPTTEIKISTSPPHKKRELITPPFMHRDLDKAYGKASWEDYGASTGSGSGSGSPSAGQLTAGSWRDLDNWEDWKKTNKDEKVSAFMKTWGIYPKQINKIHLEHSDGTPAKYISATLKDKSGNTLWSCMSDQKGDLYLWPNLFIDSASTLDMEMELKYNSMVKTVDNIEKYINSTKSIRIHEEPMVSNRIEIGFMVDATGSMGDEIQYLQAELVDVISRIKQERPCADIRTGSVFYRDFGDDYVTRVSALDGNLLTTFDFINSQNARGGGDMPEAVEEGLAASIDQLGWSATPSTKILFVLLDAPPHAKNAAHIEKIRNYTMKAASLGIRIIPIAASGMTVSAEFLCKYLAIATNGEYIYITDDSHIGNAHIKPTGGESNVDFLNDLMVKTILNYTAVNCPEPQFITEIDSSIVKPLTQEQIDSLKQNEQHQEIFASSQWNMRFYPNPADAYLYMQLSESADNIRITNLNGETVYENKQSGQTELSLNTSYWSSGVYTVYAVKDDKFISGKLLIIH